MRFIAPQKQNYVSDWAFVSEITAEAYGAPLVPLIRWRGASTIIAPSVLTAESGQAAQCYSWVVHFVSFVTCL